MQTTDEYLPIPGYSKYVINRNGDVIRTATKRHISFRKNTSGYYVCTLIDDHDEQRQMSRHRALCTTFKPNEMANFLQIDHINAIKGDDRLDNLEWVTPKENCQRASKHGLYKGARPVMVRDIRSGEVKTYESIIAAGRDLGLNKDQMMYRLERNDGRIYPEGKQYSFVDLFKDWASIENAEYEMLSFGTAKRVMLRDLRHGNTLEFDKLGDAAKFVGLSHPGLTTILSKHYQPVLPGLYQLKFKSDPKPWRFIKDPFFELAKIGRGDAVIAEHVATGHKEIYASQLECARAHNILPTTLNYRLKVSKPGTVFSNGYTYRYYSAPEEGSTTIPEGSRAN